MYHWIALIIDVMNEKSRIISYIIGAYFFMLWSLTELYFSGGDDRKNSGRSELPRFSTTPDNVIMTGKQQLYSKNRIKSKTVFYH